jgi:MFS family permease
LGRLSIALPLIIKELNADLALASWIALVYALITASLYLPCGRLSDLLGVGKLFLAGFVFLLDQRWRRAAPREPAN